MSSEPHIKLKVDRKGLKVLGSLLTSLIIFQTWIIKKDQPTETDIFARMDSLHSEQRKDLAGFAALVANDNRNRTDAVAAFQNDLIIEFEALRQDVERFSIENSEIGINAASDRAKNRLQLQWELHQLRSTIRAPTPQPPSVIDSIIPNYEKTNTSHGF